VTSEVLELLVLSVLVKHEHRHHFILDVLELVERFLASEQDASARGECAGHGGKFCPQPWRFDGKEQQS
jgi:hypothetical protein